MSDKHQARAAALARRRAMPASTRAAADQLLAEAAARFVLDTPLIAAYVPMAGEPGGAVLLDALVAAARTVLLPVLTPDRDLDWAEYAGRLAVSSGAESPIASLLREPVGPRLGSEAVAGVDLIFVPALAVDPTGTRLGRGGGSYDRALARVPPGTPLIALLYDGEVRDHVPAEPHDRPVSAVLMPSGLHPLRESRR